MTCPHTDIRFCPLYVAAHDGELCRYGCDDGRLGEGGCGADRNLSYTLRLAQLQAAAPRFVAEIEFFAEAQQAKEQRARNMRLAGVH